MPLVPQYTEKAELLYTTPNRSDSLMRRHSQMGSDLRCLKRVAMSQVLLNVFRGATDDASQLT